jgi:hypothetical protein
MLFVIGRGKMQAIAKDGARQIGFCWAVADFDWWCEGIWLIVQVAQHRLFATGGQAPKHACARAFRRRRKHSRGVAT